MPPVVPDFKRFPRPASLDGKNRRVQGVGNRLGIKSSSRKPGANRPAPPAADPPHPGYRPGCRSGSPNPQAACTAENRFSATLDPPASRIGVGLENPTRPPPSCPTARRKACSAGLQPSADLAVFLGSWAGSGCAADYCARLGVSLERVLNRSVSGESTGKYIFGK